MFKDVAMYTLVQLKDKKDDDIPDFSEWRGDGIFHCDTETRRTKRINLNKFNEHKLQYEEANKQRDERLLSIDEISR